MEIWKDIEGYEAHYQVSNLGRVKSLCRKVWCVKNNGYSTLKESILKGGISSNDYLTVTLHINGTRKTGVVHQLVANAFLGHANCGHKLVVNHIDYNKLNNRANNLEIITNRENTNKKHLKSSSQYIGVCYRKSSGKWTATITMNKKRHNLGTFTTETEASNAYQQALTLHNNQKGITL